MKAVSIDTSPSNPPEVNGDRAHSTPTGCTAALSRRQEARIEALGAARWVLQARNVLGTPAACALNLVTVADWIMTGRSSILDPPMDSGESESPSESSSERSYHPHAALGTIPTP